MSNKTLFIFGLFCAVIFGLGNSGLHPTSGTAGYTGAPGDSSCGECHSGNNASLNGNITLSGLPTTIITGESYTITVTITNPNGNAARAGFQMVALTGTNTNAGVLAEHPDFIDNTEILTVFGGKKYIGHNPASDFPASNEITYLINWTAPASTGSNPIIKFYASSVIANGNNSSSQDRVVFTNMQIPIQSASAPLIVSLANVIGTTCSDSNNGMAQANASGGSGTYSYSWTNGVTNAINTTLPPGIATVTVTDNAGASATASTNINSPAAISISVQGTVVCQNATNGSASVIANGGTGNYSYTWSNGSTGSSISGLSVGLYTVTVSDANGCMKSGSTSINTSPEIQINENINHVTCNGLSNGSIFLTISGGTPGFSYLWSDGSTQANISNLAANSYTVTVTDAVLCSIFSTFSIDEPQEIVGTVSNLNNVSCYGENDGSATITVSGGSPPYTFLWSTGAPGSGITNTQSGFSAGNYNVTVTDFFDCETLITVNISQPDQITVNTIDQQNVTCFSNNDGTINIAVTGLTGLPSYLWSNQSTLPTIVDLSPGTYSLTVTDGGNNCTQTAVYSINEPPLLSVELNNIGDVSCNGGNNGTAFALVSGGTGIYSYLWSNGSTTNILNNITAGPYSITVTDSNGCMESTDFVIIQPPPILVELSSSSNATCIGASNGSLTISASNGFPPYQYLWQNETTTAVNNNLMAGNYAVTVTDANSCTSSASFTVQTNSSFQLEVIEVENVECHGDSTGMVSVTNNSQFTYLWSNGTTGSQLVQAPAGVYTVVATDPAACQSTPLVIDITEPPIIEVSIVEADTVLCPGESNGHLSLNINGGTGPLVWQWSNGEITLTQDSLMAGIYNIFVSDSTNCQVSKAIEIFVSDSIRIGQVNVQDVLCYKEFSGSISIAKNGGYGELITNWSNGVSNQDTISELSKGYYFITITDEANCVLKDTFMVEQPDSLFAFIVVENETQSGLNDGKIIITPIGGKSPFTIDWSNGSNSFNQDSLSPGLYSYVMSDANACQTSGWAVIGGGNCVLSASADIIQPSCFNSFDGKISVNIVGQFDTYKIQLFSESEEVFLPLDSLQAGIYTIIITDSLQCTTIIQQITLASEHPEILLDSIIVKNPTSSTSKNGSLQAIVSGGAGDLQYEWFKDGLSLGANSIISDLSVGIYTLVVTDTSGCRLQLNSIFLQTINGNKDITLSHVKLLPNPVSDILTIFNESRYPIEKVEIFDLYGKLIYRDTPIGTSEKTEYYLQDINIKESGFYIINMYIKGKKMIKKFVVQM